MILLIDNYDSFVCNLYQYLGEENEQVKVVRNDAFQLAEIDQWQPKAIIVSPGPKRPKDAGLVLSVVQHYSGKIPILGVCLGHQAIGEVFGFELVRAPVLRHGKVSPITHNGQGLFEAVPNPTTVGRYHSLVLNEKPDTPLEITARAEDDGAVMAIKHREHQTYGVQFHPESILTPCGREILRNFLATLL